MFRNFDYFTNIHALLSNINKAKNPGEVEAITSQYEKKYNSINKVMTALPKTSSSEELVKLIKSVNNILELEAIIGSEQFKKYANEILLEEILKDKRINTISIGYQQILADFANIPMELYTISIKTGVWSSAMNVASIFCKNTPRLAKQASTAEQLEQLILLPPITTSCKFSEISSNPFYLAFMNIGGIASLSECCHIEDIQDTFNALINNKNIRNVSSKYIYKLKTLYTEIEKQLQQRLKISRNFTEESNREYKDKLIEIQEGLDKLDAIEFDQYVAKHGGNKRTAGALILKL